MGWLIIGGIALAYWLLKHYIEVQQDNKELAVRNAARCTHCTGRMLNGFWPRANFTLPFRDAECWYCPTCFRIYASEGTHFRETTRDWIKVWTGISYCTRCGGFVDVSSDDPPRVVCSKCGTKTTVGPNTMQRMIRTAGDPYG